MRCHHKDGSRVQNGNSVELRGEQPIRALSYTAITFGLRSVEINSGETVSMLNPSAIKPFLTLFNHRSRRVVCHVPSITIAELLPGSTNWSGECIFEQKQLFADHIGSLLVEVGVA
jgi:hypothetical protein